MQARRHHRQRLRLDALDIRCRNAHQYARARLDDNALRELLLNDTGIRCRRGYDTRSFVLAGKACTWIHDRLQDVVLRTDLTDVGEVGTEGRAVSGHRVAGRTHSLAVEDSTTALYVACTQRRLQLFQSLQSRSLLLRYLLH